MSHSEKICRVGSATLSPLIAIGIGAAFAGVCAGFVWLLDRVLPHAIPDPTHVNLVGTIFAVLAGVVLISSISYYGLYPWLYRHCRGSELLAKFEALDAELLAASNEYQKKKEDIDKRIRDLMYAERANARNRENPSP